MPIIWIILFFIIILISSVLAYRSMRDYEEFPDSDDLSSLFYIAAPQNLTEESLRKLHDLNLSNKRFFSLEKLIKGKEKAWVVFGSRGLAVNFPELNLIELEDYLINTADLAQSSEGKSVNVNQAISWLVSPKKIPDKLLQVTEELGNLVVEDNQKVFIQIILMPIDKPSGGFFQATMRVMVADSDPIKRVELAKRTERAFTASTGLNKFDDTFSEGKRFDSFKLRTLIPKEVAEFYFTPEEVLSIIKA